MNDAPIDCLCLGIVVADHVCEPIDHLPRSGELVLTERTTLTLGGCAANVAVDLCGWAAERSWSAALATIPSERSSPMN